MTRAADIEPIVLPTVLDLHAAQELSEWIKTRIENRSRVVIDAAAVEVLTVPCIQILVSAARDHGLEVLSPSQEFTQAFDDLCIEPPRLSEAPIAASKLSAPPDAAVTMPTEGAPSVQRILTIDDSKTMRDMLMLTLSEAGYEVLQGVDGQDGIEVLGDQTVDAVITDINMPRMDGYGVIRELRKKPHLDHTPILVLTTESEKDKRDIARASGATGWMVKPFDPKRLVATLRKVLPANGAAAAVEVP